MRQAAALPAAAVFAPPIDPAGEEMLDSLQRATFNSVIHQSKRHNGLVANTSRPGARFRKILAATADAYCRQVCGWDPLMKKGSS